MAPTRLGYMSNMLFIVLDFFVCVLAQVQFHKPTFRHPLRPGLWTLRLMYQWTTTVAETRFLVLPLAFYFGRPVSADQAPFLNGGPGQAYVEHDFSNVEALLGRGNRSALVRQALANSRRFGRDLHGWLESLTSGFWSVQSTCYVSQPRHPAGGAVCATEIDPCHLSHWSSKSPDPKSTIRSADRPERSRTRGAVRPDGGTQNGPRTRAKRPYTGDPQPRGMAQVRLAAGKNKLDPGANQIGLTGR